MGRMILVSVIALIVLYLLFTYFIVFHRSTYDLSQKQPYRKLIGKEYKLKKEVGIIENDDVNRSFVAFEIIDIEHKETEAKRYSPAIDEMQAGEETNEEGIVYVDSTPAQYKFKIPAGTLLKIQKVKKLRRKGIFSKEQDIYIIGTIFIEQINKEVSFEFHWGENEFRMVEPEPYMWVFFDPPWQ